MNTDETTAAAETVATSEELEAVPAKTASPFTGLVAVGQMFPLNGVWCRVVKFDGPHIFLAATEYTTKIKRYINAHNRTRARRKKD